MDSDCEAKYKRICSAAAETLIGAGYKCSKGRARKTVERSCGLIEFQRSQSNTSCSLKFTINVGVVYAELLDDGCAMSKTYSLDSHIRVRIGFLMPERNDKWWTIDGPCDTNAIEREVVSTLASAVVPYVDRYLGNLPRCVEMWESGVSPGLTRDQRDRLILRARAAL